MLGFNWLDWAFIIILTVSTLLSLKRGFFKEAFSLVIWLAAIACSLMFSEQFSPYLENLSASPSVRKLLAMGLLFVSTLIVGGIIRLLISQLIDLTGLTATDRVLGMVFGALRGVLIIVVISFLAKKILPIEKENWWQASRLAPHFNQLELWTVEKVSYLTDVMNPIIHKKTT